ncbi:TonB-dependent receptor [Sphingopyxis witflariensis]|uniref:TonB-dependent receptor n=1 Tax=Sphingopyxis witflariensis TaxID=173675 RepID=A0A246K464_9SPHN|nr:TonB-dependent receptor [Sphingopyxis witflariensis]OWR00360.1 TonB-dependent receptor [Sphingopyxis witflariensis]
MNHINRALLGASIAAIAFAGQAHAQAVAPAADTPSQQPVEVETANQAPDSGDIVVTANKREQRLNDVGITVAVVSGDALQNRQINSLADLANATPSLSFTNSANGTPVYTLRGVGFYETSIGAYPTVSTYVDEAPLAFPVLSSHSAFDLERVEILKGPQGTLFGQNATGGAINYIAAKPTNELSAGGSISYGRFNEVVADAFISGPISSTLSARLAGRIERADGWQISNSRPGDRNGKVENYMGRLLIDFEPTERLRFKLNINGWKDNSETQAPQYIALFPQVPAFVTPQLAAAQFSPERPQAADWTPGVPRRSNRLGQATLRTEFDVSDDVTLTSLTSYVDYKQRQGDEGDGLPLSTLDLVNNIGRIKSFNQELRISNNSGSDFRWVVGANYERSKVNELIDLSFPDVSVRGLYGSFGYPFFSLSYSNDQKMENYAGFANIEYDIGQLTVKLGGRYTKSRTDASECGFDDSGSPINTGPLFYDVLFGGALGPYAGQCYQINNTPDTYNGVAPGASGRFTDTLKEDNFSWRVGLDYKPVDDVLLYANVAKGYKAGSYPTLSASLFSQYLPVVQESVQSYEAGFKATLLDRTLQLNGAVFYYDYTNKQLRSKFVDPNFGILDVLQNIPKSDVKGFEIEMSIRPTQGLVINNTFTYLDATIKEFTGINSGGISANFAGANVPYTPKYQFGSNIDYEFPVSDSLNAFLGTSLNFRSKTVATIGGETNPAGVTSPVTTVFGIDDYVLIDLRAGVAAADDSWRVSVWGKNVGNEYYWNNVVAAFDTIQRYAGKPATYGVSVSFRY